MVGLGPGEGPGRPVEANALPWLGGRVGGWVGGWVGGGRFSTAFPRQLLRRSTHVEQLHAAWHQANRPRLIDLFVRSEALDGLVLCPCCLKGGLGGAVVRAARARKACAHELLVRTLGALVEDELRGSAAVSVAVDAAVLSPKNAFIVAAKRGGGGALEARLVTVCVACE